MYFFIAQIFGFIGLILLVVSYQVKLRRKLITLQICANLFYGVQYLLLGATSGLMIMAVATLRCFVFNLYVIKEKDVPLFQLIIFLILPVTLAPLIVTDVVTALPILVACIFTYALWQKNMYVTYVCAIIVCVIWSIYMFVVGAYISIIANVIEIIGSIVGIIRRYRNIKSEAKLTTNNK
ncbi:MAG: YgjV family protein [Clostridia bacterium]|nr:YgjV family protein [Clostridia bacterium]